MTELAERAAPAAALPPARKSPPIFTAPMPPLL